MKNSKSRDTQLWSLIDGGQLSQLIRRSYTQVKIYPWLMCAWTLTNMATRVWFLVFMRYQGLIKCGCIAHLCNAHRTDQRAVNL